MRLSAGIDLATLARRCIVSTKQVQQLEEGGDSSFYNDEIKISIGKKLLQHLGHDLIVEEAPSIAPASSPNAQSEAEAPALVSSSSNNLPTHSAITKAWVLLPLLSSALLVGSAAWFWAGQETHVPETAEVLKPEALKPEAMTTTASALETETKAANVPVAPNLEEIAKPVIQMACSWNNVEEAIQPDTPQKAGEYVHVISQQPLTVCIMDGQQRIATLNLQAGDGRSVYGKPPFKVYSSDLKAVKVYFQGQLIKLENQETQQIKLSAAEFTPLKN